MKNSIIVASIVVTLFAVFASTAAALPGFGTQGMEFPKPGPEHAVLKQFEGNWDAVTSGMGESTKSTQSSKLACGGLWLMTTYNGEFMEVPFEGRGLMGYDPEGKKYQNVWVDSGTSKITVESGTWDEKTKALKFDSKSPDGSPRQMVFTFQDADHYTLRFVGKDTSGKEVDQFKISYTRQSAKAPPK